MMAYGVTARAHWTFYALFLPYLASFVAIPGGLGAIGAVLVANLMPRPTIFVRNLTQAPALLSANALSGQVVPLEGPGQVR